MSDHVTWEVCPHCWGIAAVGWAPVDADGRTVEHRPVEFDCRTGCRVGLAELADVLGLRRS